MSFSYRSEQWLPYPVEEVFAFFADPDNLPALLPPRQKARIEKVDLAPPPPRASASKPVTTAGSGSLITLSFRPFPFCPVRVRWQAEIHDFAWNEGFCDRQLRGPFASWNHCHYVRRIDAIQIDVTLVTDVIEYELPLGPIGQLAHRLFVRKQIENIFAYRQDQLARLFPRKTPSASVPSPSHAKRTAAS
jgi:ligand-binding SRPBCC domain-containing protein